MPAPKPPRSFIHLRGVRQNNLRGVDARFPRDQLTVVTGVSGSGKSSLVFDTLHAEGQRRYVECLSSYARQFLDRMPRPDCDGIDGILPSVAIEQGKRVRTARATVATITEVLDVLRIVFAAAARATCPGCGAAVRRDHAPQLVERLIAEAIGLRAVVTFPLRLVSIAAAEVALEGLQQSGYHRILEAGQIAGLAERPAAERAGQVVHVVQDRLAIDPAARTRLFDSIDQALGRGDGTIDVWLEGAPEGLADLRLGDLDGAPSGLIHHRMSRDLSCSRCGTEMAEPSPALFSYNSALGACPTCNGFGRTIAVDEERCIPDPNASLARGAIKPWTTRTTSWERRQLRQMCEREGVEMNVPWALLPQATRDHVLIGDGQARVKRRSDERYWGLREWFKWLEKRTYKMHVRILLARYRKYVSCTACAGRRLRPEALAWRLDGADLPGWLALPVAVVMQRLEGLDLPPRLREGLRLPLEELTARVGLLDELGLGYLSLDRSGRTLSGGELQRVQVAAALSGGLAQVLYVLDEPSVGLHPRDNARLLGVLDRLCRTGNTVVLVEHDPAIIAAADHVIDVGPGAGERGGEVVFEGTYEALLRSPTSVTGIALRRARSPSQATPAAGDNGREPREPQRWLTVVGATARNLRGADIRFAHGQLNVLCGVSGSGKSTLIEDVLHRCLLRARGLTTNPPGACTAIEGADDFADVIAINQEPLAGSSRANCATYLKVWDAVRKRLAADPLSVRRGYTASTFSFNRAGGRCDVCEGAGYESVEMQFLSDVRIVCEACSGRRFNRDVLDVRLRGYSAADLLAMTASEVATVFGDDVGLARPMRRLCDVGLGYLRLGQPLSTLSGGEAQRLKIVAHLLRAKTRRALFLLDEPSTGLHVDDVQVLLANLRALTAAGNTVIVIEHHLDVIEAADRVIELGPGGGPDGGHVLFAGGPSELRQVADSPTAICLREADTTKRGGDAKPGADPNSAARGETRADDRADDRPDCRADDRPDSQATAELQVRGARVHNLRDLNVDIPRDRFVVVTGLSGSGKSSLAFDVVFAEGQRRFLDCLSPYIRQVLPPAARPDVDALDGLPPTIAISQRTTRGGVRSTVATLTDIQPYLRLLYARCAVQHCPSCGEAVSARSASDIAAVIGERFGGAPFALLAPVIRGRKGQHREVIERARAAGRSHLIVDGELLVIGAVPELARFQTHDIDEVIAAFGAGDPFADVLQERVAEAIAVGTGTVRIRTGDGALTTLSRQRNCEACGIGMDEPDPLLFSFTSKRGWCPHCKGTGTEPPAEAAKRKRRGRPSRHRKQEEDKPLAGEGADGSELLELRVRTTCNQCDGSRLRDLARSLRIGGQRIDEVSARTAPQLAEFLADVRWGPREAQIAGPIVAEVVSRCRFLERIGLGYLGLDRGAPTLSGGESQRIRLAAQLGSNLCGVLYVLDEPTIGLHPTDNMRLLAALDDLIERGNGLLVVEHDEATIRRASHVIELGPGAGQRGGRLLHSGPLAELLESSDSPTAAMLRDPRARRVRVQPRPVGATTPRVDLIGARCNNLAGIDVAFPRGRFTVVSGVSGSGKSTLVRDLLVRVGNRILEDGDGGLAKHSGELDGLRGLDGVGRLIEVDQSPIGRTPRSCPATYMGVFDPIRRLFASLPEAKVLGITASRFSFNVKGGRCETCMGAGVERVEMSFLPTVYTPCEACGGSRYNGQTLTVRYAGAHIADVLAMTLAEAADHFRNLPAVHRPLAFAERIGLGYLRLGQPSYTLSGGEAQRVKIVSEIAHQRRSESLFVLDEPSTGLHLSDVRRLLTVLHELVDRGDTLVVIEHNLDVLREADWCIDLGPGGGERGGRVIWQGPVDALCARGEGETARALRLEAEAAAVVTRGRPSQAN